MAEKTKAVARVNNSPTKKRPVERYQDDPLMMLAVEKDFDIARLEKLIDMRDREDAKKAKRAFDENFALMQAEVDVIVRNKTASKPIKRGDEVVGSEDMYNYATIGAAKAQIQKVLTKYGFSFRWRKPQVNHESKWVSITFVLSGWGHEEETTREGPILQPTMRQNVLQALEGTYTYLKRYSMWDGLGLASDDDDRDGGGETVPQGPQPKRSKAYDAAVEELRAEFREMSTSELFGGKELDKYEVDAKKITAAGNVKDVQALEKAWDAELKRRRDAAKKKGD